MQLCAESLIMTERIPHNVNLHDIKRHIQEAQERG